MVFKSRAAADAGDLAQPQVPVQQLNVWYSCDTVFFRYRVVNSEDITGVAVLETVRAPSEEAPFPWLIEKAFDELNSAAYLVALGVFTPECSPNATRKG